MPRFDYGRRDTPLLSTREVLLMQVLLAEVNRLRAHVGLKPRTVEEVHDEVIVQVRAHAIAVREQGGS